MRERQLFHLACERSPPDSLDLFFLLMRKVDVDGVWSDLWSSSIGLTTDLSSFGALATVGGLWVLRKKSRFHT